LDSFGLYTVLLLVAKEFVHVGVLWRCILERGAALGVVVAVHVISFACAKLSSATDKLLRQCFEPQR